MTCARRDLERLSRFFDVIEMRYVVSKRFGGEVNFGFGCSFGCGLGSGLRVFFAVVEEISDVRDVQLALGFDVWGYGNDF